MRDCARSSCARVGKAYKVCDARPRSPSLHELKIGYCGLTGVLSDEVESVQKRCMRIIFPHLSYSDAIAVAGLERLSARRETAVIKLFNEIKNETHVLHSLLPVKPTQSGLATRDNYPYRLPRARTERRSRSLINYCIKKKF